MNERLLITRECAGAWAERALLAALPVALRREWMARQFDGAPRPTDAELDEQVHWQVMYLRDLTTDQTDVWPLSWRGLTRSWSYVAYLRAMDRYATGDADYADWV